MIRSRMLVVTLVAVFLAAAAWSADTPGGWSDGLPRALPEEVGLSQERLDRIGAVMERYIEEGRIAGAIGLVSRRGKVAYFETFGNQDVEAGTPMAPDAIFRIYSMSKAVTSVAVMILHEEHGFSLNTAASHWLPELAAMDVAVDRTDPASGQRKYSIVPAKSDMTVRDLLTHTSGLSYAGPRDARRQSIFEKLGVRDRDQTLEEFVQRIAQAPLHNHPGEVWQYGYSMDVLGRLVEVISGDPFDVFLEERVFAPLRMKDTAFSVPAGQENRLAVLYSPIEDRTLRRSTSAAQDSYLRPAKLLYGGAGLVSTTEDYLRLCQMLLNGGELGGVRILGRKSVELMSSDHIGDIPRVGSLSGEGNGFGLTFRVNLSPGLNGALGSVGEYSWGGAAGTRFWIDPAEEMVTLFMVQILPYRGLPYGTEFKNLVYQAIVD